MAGISFRQRGNFNKTKKMLKKTLGRDYLSVLDRYGRVGVQVLSEATPKESGLTSSSWFYKIVEDKAKGTISIQWHNDNNNKGFNIAVMLQYGHATRNGGWVEGKDYINPALKPIFDHLAESAWKAITTL